MDALIGYAKEHVDMTLADAAKQNPRLTAPQIMQRMSKLHALATRAGPVPNAPSACAVLDPCGGTFVLGGAGGVAATSVCAPCMRATASTQRSAW